MYKLKKALCSSAAFCMTLVLMITGCGVKELPSNRAAVETATTEALTSIALEQEPYEVNYYYVSGGAQPNNQKIEEAANKYLKENLGINSTLKLNCFDWGTYDQKIRAMFAASEYMDLVWSTNWAVDTFARVRDGSFLEIGSLLEKALKLKAEFGDLLDKAKIDGKYYVLPQKKETTFTNSIIYNKTLADKYGIDMTGVNSMETLEPKLKEFHEKDPMTQAWHGGMGVPLTQNFDSDGFLGILVNGKFESMYHSSTVKSAYILLNKWAKLGYIAKDAITKDAGPSIEAGNYFAYAEANGAKPGLAAEKNAHFKYVIEQIDISKPFTGNWSIFGTVTAIARSTKNAERSMQVLEALNTDKYLTNLINFGIENENYIKIDENTIELIKDSGYSPEVPWEIGNRSLCYLMPTEPKNLYQLYKDAAVNAEVSKMLGFVPDYTPVSKEKSALHNLQKEYERALIAGWVDDVKYNEFLKKIEIAGINKLLSEEQKQYDAWKLKSKN